MTNQRADRNKTITLSNTEIDQYAGLCPGICETDQPVDMIFHGDAFEILRTLPKGFVDLLIVDPPYNMSKVFGSKPFSKMNESEYLSFTRQWIEAVRHTLAPNATVYICSDWHSSLSIGMTLSEYFTIQNRITWQRDKGRGATHNWKNTLEDIWFATVSPRNYTFNAGAVKMRRRVIAPYKANGIPKDWVEGEDGNYRDTFPSNFWDDISIPYWSMPENTNHPTQKPEKLFAKLILASSNPGDLILDPFVGSGTSAVAARKLGRKFIGIEREAEYCAYAQKRLEMAEAAIGIQGYAQGVFWERNTFALQKRNKAGK
ncbi:MAG: site-specific DNA-methyltransferase [Clostridiales bacterium]|nr:site-specific DNA-methyltransferase [Clostridiales bacterium]